MIEEMLASLRQEFEYTLFAVDGLETPKFDKVSMVHDWRNHVPDTFKDRWNMLSNETRLAIYAMAEVLASREEWD